MSKARHRQLGRVFVNVALANDVVVCLAIAARVVQAVGVLLPVFLFLPLGALFNSAFLILHLARVSSKKLKIFIEASTHFLLFIYSVILTALSWALLIPRAPWYWWIIVGYLSMSGILSLTTGLLISKEEITSIGNRVDKQA